MCTPPPTVRRSLPPSILIAATIVALVVVVVVVALRLPQYYNCIMIVLAVCSSLVRFRLFVSPCAVFPLITSRYEYCY